MIKDQEKAAFWRGEKIIPDKIGVFDFVLGFFMAKSQEVKDPFNDVISDFGG